MERDTLFPTEAGTPQGGLGQNVRKYGDKLSDQAGPQKCKSAAWLPRGLRDEKNELFRADSVVGPEQFNAPSERGV